MRGAGFVLVIDDEAVVRGMAEATLTRYGYTVLLAEDGGQGVKLFREHAPAISLVLLDMTMPVMGGEEALEEIRHLNPAVPVIGSSGYSESTAKERFGNRSGALLVMTGFFVWRLGHTHIAPGGRGARG